MTRLPACFLRLGSLNELSVPVRFALLFALSRAKQTEVHVLSVIQIVAEELDPLFRKPPWKHISGLPREEAAELLIGDNKGRFPTVRLRGRFEMAGADPMLECLGPDVQQLSQLIESILTRAVADRTLLSLHGAVESLLRAAELLSSSLVAMFHDEVDDGGIPHLASAGTWPLDSMTLQKPPTSGTAESGELFELTMKQRSRRLLVLHPKSLCDEPFGIVGPDVASHLSRIDLH
jgi:hypothetical protein